MQADIAGFDKTGQLRIIIEVKNKLGTTSNWAAQMRRNVLAHGILPTAEYFLLALPDRFYLWRGVGQLVETRPPDYETDASRLVGPYMEKAGLRPELLGEHSLELIVAGWLNECIQASRPEDLPEASRDWLMHSGIFDVLQGGRLELEARL